MNGRSEGRGCVAENGRGVLGVAVDFFDGTWRGFELDDPSRSWTSRSPRAWYGPVVPFLRARIVGEGASWYNQAVE